MRATLFVIPDPNWYGEAVIYVTADNEYDYTDIDTLTVTVNSVYDQIIEPEMVYPPNGHTINFETMLDSIVLSWNGASYPEFETGPGFEYRLRIVQSNENGNIPYNFTDISDTSFTFSLILQPTRDQIIITYGRCTLPSKTYQRCLMVRAVFSLLFFLR